MMKHTAFFIVSLFLFLSLGCVPAKSQSKKDKKNKDEKFSEDLSSYRLKFEPKKDSTPSRLKSNEFIPPQKDVTKELNSKLDTTTYGKGTSRTMNGYRVMVYSGKDKNEVKKARADVYEVLPDADIYQSYHSPNTRVKVGNCVDRVEAYRLYGILKKKFPNAVIIPDQINIIAR